MGLGSGQEDVIGLCWPSLSDIMGRRAGRRASSSQESGVSVGGGAGGHCGGSRDHDCPTTMVSGGQQRAGACSGVRSD